MANDSELRKRLNSEIERVRKLPKPPPNESCTCYWVINSLLEAAGYEKHEILLQGAISAGVPDYTILPQTDYTWYLEAKDWKVTLDKSHAVQAVNYANAQGKRWVVLSNGRQWHLYDNYLRERPAEDRLVVSVELESPDLIDFLFALSKPSVTSGQLERYVVQKQIKDVLDEQLKNPSSKAITMLTEFLRKEGITDVQPDDIVNYFGLKTPPPPPPPPPNNVYTLAELHELRDKLAFNKPTHVQFPDQTIREVSSWKEMAGSIVEWFAQHNRLPELPIPWDPRSKRWFVAREPVHGTGTKMAIPYRIDTPQGELFIEAFCSSGDHIRSIHTLFQAAGEPPEGLVITLKDPIPMD